MYTFIYLLTSQCSCTDEHGRHVKIELLEPPANHFAAQMKLTRHQHIKVKRSLLLVLCTFIFFIFTYSLFFMVSYCLWKSYWSCFHILTSCRGAGRLMCWHPSNARRSGKRKLRAAAVSLSGSVKSAQTQRGESPSASSARPLVTGWLWRLAPESPGNTSVKLS